MDVLKSFSAARNPMDGTNLEDEADGLIHGSERRNFIQEVNISSDLIMNINST